MKYTYYGHLTSKEAELAAKKKYILVLPIGAIEQHGPHLPIDTDDWLALKAAKEGVELAVKKYKINAMYLPGIHFGQSFSHLAWPGRISLSFNTFVLLIYEVIDQLVKEGFIKFAIVNGNGGNEPSIITAIRQLTEKWKEKKKDIKIYTVGVGNILKPPLPDDFPKKIKKFIKGKSNDGEVHAGARETSWNLSGRPELVRFDLAKKPKIKKVDWANSSLDEISSNGTTGNPKLASKALGKYFWEKQNNGFAKMLYSISKKK
tara:strand:+ start:1040 stop:1822 length:783 start_codon:yes stop_codon:yes gene_type:complete